MTEMTTTLNETPSSQRIHIGFFGRRNAGKSSIINALTGQSVSIVSDVAGTTTDPVYKPMEIHGIGACVLIDTAGFDDTDDDLGQLRIQKTKLAGEKSDIAVMLFSDNDMLIEKEWCSIFAEKHTPVIAVISKADTVSDVSVLAQKVKEICNVKPIIVSSTDKTGTDELREALIAASDSSVLRSITGRLVCDGDKVLLVMPQDIQAPQGRLILPQVQTIRELLDRRCVVVSVTADKLETGLSSLNAPPALIITDSQIFAEVYAKKPSDSRLTSFSVLFAAYKGDIDYYCEGAAMIDSLTENSHVLIAECCTHAPMSEDIGRVKLPRMLRKRVGEKLTVDIVSGTDFPADLSGYDLVIQCGACMFNRKYVMSRIDTAKQQSIPMTNYGVAIAYLTGILDKIDKNV